jgi:hypothetical protein
MAARTTIISVRIAVDLLDRIYDCFQAQNLNRKDEPYCRNTWIVKAIHEKLQHAKRSRGRRKRHAASLPDPMPEDQNQPDELHQARSADFLHQLSSAGDRRASKDPDMTTQGKEPRS